MTDGPFTIVWETLDHRTGATQKQHEAIVATEGQAVRLWESATLYANTRPVSISPEPDWTRYTYDGHTHLNR